jgi:uncharacterized protein YmfQ (DUF2313 family)
MNGWVLYGRSCHVAKAWSRDEDGDLNLFLRALARRLSQTEFDAENLLPEMRPETTFMLLEEWENTLNCRSVGS